jgi:two-component system response regulator YesN
MLNVLVIEDEEYVRKSIVYKVDWDRIGLRLVKEAENGFQALEIIENEDIDIVITDIKMPGMSGLELIEKIKETHDRIRFVIVSGYSEFEYAKKAMLNHVSDYILKPVKGVHLERTLTKIREEILEEKVDILYRKNIEKSIKENSELIKNYYFIKLLLQETETEDTPMYVDKLIKDFEYDWFHVSTLRVIPKLLNEKESGTMKRKSVDSIISRMKEIYDGKDIKIYNNLRNSYEWIILNNFDENQYKSLRCKHTQCIECINKEFGVNCIIGMGTKVKGLRSISKSYAHAEYALKEAIILGLNRIIDYQPPEKPAINLSWINVSEDKIINKYLDNGDTSSLKEYIVKVFEDLSKWDQKINHHTYFGLALDLFVTIKRYLQRNSSIVFQGNEMEPEFLNELTRCCTLEGVIRWCENCINWYESLISDNFNNSGKELVASIRKYIVNNYGMEISLNSIAEKYNISPNYLSKLFKIYTNESFKSFLTKIRMEKAIELITNSELKLYNIAEIVGYDDPKYFSKVFKNYFGFSPSQFNES